MVALTGMHQKLIMQEKKTTPKNSKEIWFMMKADNIPCANISNGTLIKNQALFSHIHIINQKFDIVPDAPHYGIAIDYVDLLGRVYTTPKIC